MNEWAELVGMKTVSTPESCRFIWAICSSFSKSETARRPLTMAEAPTSRATFTTSVLTDSIRTPGRWPSDSSSISRRSSSVNSGAFFCGLRTTATTTSSKSRAALSTTSRWPLWKGSNEPGRRATLTRRAPAPRRGRGLRRGVLRASGEPR